MSKTKIKLAAAPRLELLYKQDHIIIPILKGQTSRLIEFLAIGEGLNLEKEYELELKISRSKRSKDANAYFWTLCNQLAGKLHQTDIEVYRDIIRDYGVRTIVPIAEKAVPRWTENWEQKRQRVDLRIARQVEARGLREHRLLLWLISLRHQRNVENHRRNRRRMQRTRNRNNDSRRTGEPKTTMECKLGGHYE